MELGRKAGSSLLHPGEPCPCPEINLDEVRRAARFARKSETIGNSIAQLEAWEDGYRNGTGFLRWPICSTTAQGIDEIWESAFIPLRRWVNQTAICVAAEVQRDYRNFRLERGVVTYDDQIALADELLQHPEAAHRIRQLDPIVILDEAQDTDPTQWSIMRRAFGESDRALVLTRPQWRSWLVKGAVIITAYGAVLGVHYLLAFRHSSGPILALAFIGFPLAVMTAVYTAYLFAQAKARDLWQNPLLPPHLLVQALLLDRSYATRYRAALAT
jgi:hypothetical protein